MLIKITNGSVDTYPYSVGQLRRDNPKTSFPKKIPSDMLSSYGVESVVVADIPSYTERTQTVSQDAQPALVEGAWTLGWTVTEKTSEEVQEYDDNEASSVRSQRDGLLAQSDWTQVADAPVDATAWATYRQALRDITDQASFPYDINWPTQP